MPAHSSLVQPSPDRDRRVSIRPGWHTVAQLLPLQLVTPPLRGSFPVGKRRILDMEGQRTAGRIDTDRAKMGAGTEDGSFELGPRAVGVQDISGNQGPRPNQGRRGNSDVRARDGK